MSGYIDRVVQIAVHSVGEGSMAYVYVLYENGDLYRRRVSAIVDGKWEKVTLPHEERS